MKNLWKFISFATILGFVGLAGAVITSLISYFFYDQNPLLGIIIGFNIFTITLAIDLIGRLEKHEQLSFTTRCRVNDNFESILKNLQRQADRTIYSLDGIHVEVFDKPSEFYGMWLLYVLEKRVLI